MGVFDAVSDLDDGYFYPIGRELWREMWLIQGPKGEGRWIQRGMAGQGGL